ncbi:hypothetical protein [Xanthomonas sp. MUS 060]|uniref:hypothetical protein n=1 Tax=Xanthomonas sp. MUS 060 TaxID=1588031 RepID=UPI0005F2B21E|nr:hypothetical protein [Xanthomonas sp. MUS 060]
MNLPLHFGLPGSLEAGLIALAVGFLLYALWDWLGRRLRWSEGQRLGGACLLAVAASAGVDCWNLFYTSIVRLESPLYARIALGSIHDPDELGSRVVLEVGGALAGVALAWVVFSSRSKENAADHDHEIR